MKTILVPIDFSRASETAFDYAVEIVKITRDKLVLVHVNHPDIKLNAREVNELETQLLNLCLLIAHRAGTESSFEYRKGDLEAQLAKVADETHASMIIMGQGSYKSFSKLLFGSNSVNTLSNVQIPVMVIPEAFRFKGLKTVTYATNYKPSDIPVIAYLADFLMPFKSQINLLHVSGENLNVKEEKREMSNFKEIITSGIDYPYLSFQIMSGSDLSAKFQEYISSGSADMIIISTHINSHWNRLFDPSITNDILDGASLPILAFHHNKSASVKLFA